MVQAVRRIPKEESRQRKWSKSQGWKARRKAGTSEGKYSSMDDNSECNDDEVVLTEDEEEVLLKANNAFTSTLTDIDLRSNPRLKNKMLRSFEKYKEETKALLMKLKLMNKDLQDKLHDQNDEIKELKIGLAKEKEEIGVDPKELEEARWANTDLKDLVGGS